MTEKFNVLFLEDAAEFLETIDAKAREKVLYNIYKARVTNDKELFKKLNNEIWEFRTLFNRTHYRLFAFWDRRKNFQTVVISTHGIIKKTGKTPKAELERAEKIRRNYFENKD